MSKTASLIGYTVQAYNCRTNDAVAVGLGYPGTSASAGLTRAQAWDSVKRYQAEGYSDIKVMFNMQPVWRWLSENNAVSK